MFGGTADRHDADGAIDFQDCHLDVTQIRNTVFAQGGLDARGGTPAEFAAFIKEDFARWTKVVKEANIKVE